MPTQQYKGNGCVAATGTMTRSVSAQRTLLSAGISAEVVALAPTDTRNGCSYGVEYPCTEDKRARIALRNARIPISQYLRKDGG